MCKECFKLDECGLDKVIVNEVEDSIKNLIEDIDGLFEQKNLDWTGLCLNLRRMVLREVAHRFEHLEVKPWESGDVNPAESD